jgi:hypothetical protein
MTKAVIDEVEQWEATYRPITNTTREEWDGLLFETYGDDLAYVLSVAKKNLDGYGHGWMQKADRTSSTGIIS